jgi:hypothetical protein
MNAPKDVLTVEDQDEIREHGMVSKSTRGMPSGPLTEQSVIPLRLA